MSDIPYPVFKNELRNILEPKCNKCTDLVSHRCQISWGYGPLTSKIMFIAKSPSEGDSNQERWQGSNFTGIPFTDNKSGKLFRSQIAKMGFDLANDFYVTNTVKCFSNKLQPKHKNNCRKHLEKEIKTIQPELIICVGGIALKEVYKSITGKSKNVKLGNAIKEGVTKIFDYNVAAMIQAQPGYFHYWLKKYGFIKEDEYLSRYRSILLNYLK
jgi:uracil-DNA glycosylase